LYSLLSEFSRLEFTKNTTTKISINLVLWHEMVQWHLVRHHLTARHESFDQQVKIDRVSFGQTDFNQKTGCHKSKDNLEMMVSTGNTKGGSITVLLTSCLTGLETAVWHWQFLFLFSKQTYLNQSNRRSMVQWYFPLKYSLVNSVFLIARPNILVKKIGELLCNLLFSCNWVFQWVRDKEYSSILIYFLTCQSIYKQKKWFD